MVDRATYDRFWAAIAQHWGTPETWMIPFLAPSQVGDDAYLRWWMRYERLSSTPRDLLAGGDAGSARHRVNLPARRSHDSVIRVPCPNEARRTSWVPPVVCADPV
jgi:hypothetical protein